MSQETSSKRASTPSDPPVVGAKNLDQALRPSDWDQYVGQATIKENLRILLQAAKGRKHQPEHILFYGPPGLGKITYALDCWS